MATTLRTITGEKAKRERMGACFAPYPGCVVGYTKYIKQQRFHDHIKWASDRGCLDVVEEFLIKIPENDWHHFDDL